MQAFAGIDVAFAKGKPLPISVCVWRNGILVPLPLRTGLAATPPRGQGNAKVFDKEALKEFAESTVTYLREVERAFGVTIRRIAIDAPSEPKPDGAYRRKNELGLAERGIRYIPTPDARQFEEIREEVQAHLAHGGSEFGLPHANQLWMLAGFALFKRLRREWECLETFPQAIAVTLGAAKIHKSRMEGLLGQLAAAARFTGWPEKVSKDCLNNIGYGSGHDKLDAYLSAWVASLEEDQREAIGEPPDDVIWVPKIKPRLDSKCV